MLKARHSRAFRVLARDLGIRRPGLDTYPDQGVGGKIVSSIFKCPLGLTSTPSVLMRGFRRARPSRIRIAAFALSLAILASPLRTHARPAFQAASTYFDAQGEAQLLALTNQARAEHGLPPLQSDPRLIQAARKHCALMAKHSELEHQLPGEPSLPIRIADEGVAANHVSENIAFNNRDIPEAQEGLMHSPPHRATILSAVYDAIGIGVLRDGDEIWVTEDFARKLPEYSTAQAESAVQLAIAAYAQAHKLYPPSRKPELQLRQMACNMAARDRLDGQNALQMPGARGALAWTADDPARLPKGIGPVLAGGTSADAVGVCFASSKSHPGGVYWIVMVTY